MLPGLSFSQRRRRRGGAAVRGSAFREHPPYRGSEPYLNLCFSEADAPAAGDLLSALSSRGVRVWYEDGHASDGAARKAAQERANGASLTVVWSSETSRDDRRIKASALYQQSKGRPVIVVDADRSGGGPTLGLAPGTAHVDAWAMAGAAEVEEALVRTPGFTQELIGEKPPAPAACGRSRALALALSAVALAALVLALFGAQAGWFADSALHADDTLPLTSPELIVAARSELDGAPITPESAAEIRVLTLAALPDDLSELSWFEGLERLEIPQDEAEAARALLEQGVPYEIVLREG